MHAVTLNGVTIDRCRECDSAWLDAGEFDAVQSQLLAKQPERRPAKEGEPAWAYLGEAVVNFVPWLLDGWP